MKQFVLSLMMATAVCSTALAQNKVKNVYASSTKLNVEMLQNSNQTVQLNRYFFAGYNTLCLPMTVAADQLGDVKIERFAGIRQEGNILNLYFVECTADGIQAGVPYLVNSPKSQYLRIKNTDAMTIDNEIQAVRMSDNNGNIVTFGSSWEALRVDGRYGIPAQQDALILESVLIRTEGDKSFLPTRCGFTWDEQMPTATRLEIKHVTSLAGTQTSIEKLQAEDAVVDVYNVAGQIVKKSVRVNAAMQSLPAGIYVIGGEKVAVK
jgi:hypothetical protein